MLGRLQWLAALAIATLAGGRGAAAQVVTVGFARRPRRAASRCS
jgi:hypothetical protein